MADRLALTPSPAVGVPGLLGRPYKTLRLEWSSDLRLLRVRKRKFIC